MGLGSGKAGGRVSRMPNLLVFSANADPQLIEPGARFGIEVRPYSPTPWKDYVNGKLRCGIEFLRTRAGPVATFLDGYDSLILKPEAEILARLSAPVLISAERNCFPDPERAAEFPDTGTLPRFPCAGGYIGRREELIAAMETVLSMATTGDDQRAWTAAYLAGAVPGLAIDHERRIFHSMGDGEPVGDSCTVHFNGRIPGRDEWWRAYCLK